VWAGKDTTEQPNTVANRSTFLLTPSASQIEDKDGGPEGTRKEKKEGEVLLQKGGEVSRKNVGRRRVFHRTLGSQGGRGGKNQSKRRDINVEHQ